MKLHISSDGVEITPEIEEVIDKKLVSKIQRLVSRYSEDSVTLRLMIRTGARWGFRVKCDIDLPGENVHAEEKHKELEYALVSLAKQLQQILRKKKEKELH